MRPSLAEPVTEHAFYGRFLRFLLLVAILAFAFTLAMTAKERYAYPVHIDEWISYKFADTTVQTGRLSNSDVIHDYAKPRNLELLYHAVVGELQMVTGAGWLGLFRYMGPVLYVMLCFGAYVLGRRFGFGLEAAALTGLFPTTLQALGPGFLVPLNAGLLAVMAILILLSRVQPGARTTLLALILVSFLAFAHPPSVVPALLTMLVVTGFLALRKDGRPNVGIALYLVGFALVSAGLLAALTYTQKDIAKRLWQIFLGGGLSSTRAPALVTLRAFGFIPAALGVLGAILALLGNERWKIGAALALAGLLVIVAAYTYFRVGDSVVGDRTWFSILILLALFGGMALAWLRQRLVQRLKRGGTAVVVAWTVVLVLISASGALAWQNQQEQPFYHLASDRTFADLEWIRAHVPPRFKKAITDVARSQTFAAVSGKYIFAAAADSWGSTPGFIKANRDFLQNGAKDTTLLRQNGLSMVYTPLPVDNPDLIRVLPNLYLLNEEQ